MTEKVIRLFRHTNFFSEISFCMHQWKFLLMAKNLVSYFDQETQTGIQILKSSIKSYRTVRTLLTNPEPVIARCSDSVQL